jgi:hypothetical protein
MIAILQFWPQDSEAPTLYGLAPMFAQWDSAPIVRTFNTACPSCTITTERSGTNSPVIYRTLKRPQTPAPFCARCLNLEVRHE